MRNHLIICCLLNLILFNAACGRRQEQKTNESVTAKQELLSNLCDGDAIAEPTIQASQTGQPSGVTIPKDEPASAEQELLACASLVAEAGLGASNDTPSDTGRIRDLCSEGHIDKALESAKAMTDGLSKQDALAYMVNACIGSGQLIRAREIAREVEARKDMMLKNVARQYAANGEFDNAQDVITEMDDLDQAVRALQSIAYAYAELGQIEEAQSILDQAVKKAKRIVNPRLKADAFISLARQSARVASPELANQSMTVAMKTIHGIERASTKMRGYADAADLYAELGDAKMHGQLLEKTIETVQTIDEPVERINEYFKMGQRFDKAGNENCADQMVHQVFAESADVRDSAGKFRVLIMLADRMKRKDLPRNSEIFLEYATKVAQAIKDDKTRSDSLIQLIERYSEDEQWAHVRDIESFMDQAGYCGDLASKYMSGRYADAGQYERAVANAMAIEDKFSRDSALKSVVRKLLAEGVHDLAIRTADQITDDSDTGFWIDYAQQMADAGQMDVATRQVAKSLEIVKTKSDSEAESSLVGLCAKTGQLSLALKMAPESCGLYDRLLCLAREYATTGQPLSKNDKRVLRGIEQEARTKIRKNSKAESAKASGSCVARDVS